MQYIFATRETLQISNHHFVAKSLVFATLNADCWRFPLTFGGRRFKPPKLDPDETSAKGSIDGDSLATARKEDAAL
jgi:hypothetical protein